MEGHMNLNSTVTALRYRIENHYQILSWCRWSWVRDHAWPHVVCRYVLQDERIHTTDCPSPVLNPVEQLWDTMFRFNSCRKISNALDQIWEEIAQDTICSLISGTRGAYRLLFYILNKYRHNGRACCIVRSLDFWGVFQFSPLQVDHFSFTLKHMASFIC